MNVLSVQIFMLPKLEVDMNVLCADIYVTLIRGQHECPLCADIYVIFVVYIFVVVVTLYCCFCFRLVTWPWSPY